MIYRLSHLLRNSASLGQDRMALAGTGSDLSYAQLLSSARRLATTFSELDVRPRDRVGIYLPKSNPAVTAIFGALEHGAIYVPIDPASPPKRAAYIVQDCDIQCLVTDKHRFTSLMAA